MQVVWMALLGYALGLSVLVPFLAWRLGRRGDSVIDSMRRVDLSRVDAEKRIEALAKIATAEKDRVAWYERSLSVIGIVAFFSMIIATGIQTAKVSSGQGQVEELQRQVASLRGERDSIERATRRVSKRVLAEVRERDRVSEVDRAVLEAYLALLLDDDEADLGEQLGVGLVLRRSSLVTDIADRSPEMIGALDIAEIVSVAEHYFIIGNVAKAFALIGRHKDSIDEAKASVRVRALILEAAARDDSDSVIGSVAEVLEVSRSSARRRVESGVQALRDAADRSWPE